jgi:hypothetical protein
MKTLTAVLFALLLAVAPAAFASTTQQWSTGVSGAGNTVFDGTYLWVANGTLVSAINSTGQVVANQQVSQAPVFLAYDSTSGVIFALCNNSGNTILLKFSAQAAFQPGGSPVNATALGFGAPTALAIDYYKRYVWALGGGTAYQVKMSSLLIVYSLAGPTSVTVTPKGGTTWLSGDGAVTEVTY